MKIRIRQFKDSDIEAVCRINIDNWKHEFSSVYSKQGINDALKRWTPVQRALRRIKIRLKYKWNLYVAVCNGKVGGFVSYRKEKNKVRIWTIYVDRKQHRKGIGSALLKFVERKTKAKKYTLVSASRKETLQFYEKMGYRKLRTVRKRKTGDMYVFMVKHFP